MKRFTIFILILTSLASICSGRTMSRKSQLKIIQLPRPMLTGSVSFEQLLAKRRPVYNFSSQKLDFVQMGQLAWAGQGITEKEKGIRTAPSAGDIYPIALYFATDEGVFAYDPVEHSLQQTLGQDIRSRLAKAASNQQAIAEAPCNIIVAGTLKMVSSKYGNKAKLLMQLEAGHVAQNILLQAESLDLGAVSFGAFDISTARRLCKIRSATEPLYILSIGYPAKQKIIGKTIESQVRETEYIKPKRAVMIVPSDKFRDEELFDTWSELEKAGVETFIASSKTGPIKGMLGGKTEASLLLEDIVVDVFDAIIFIGGSGAKEYFNNKVALDIASKAAQKDKVIGAISIAPTILANAGVLDGIRVTAYPSERKSLIDAGAEYTRTEVERDGKIITAIGPIAAKQFGQAVAEAVTR
jgi:protease I